MFKLQIKIKKKGQKISIDKFYPFFYANDLVIIFLFQKQDKVSMVYLYKPIHLFPYRH